MYKIKDSKERTIQPAFFHNTLHGSFTYTFDSSKSKTNIAIMVYGKLQVTFIHIRPQCLNTHCFTFVHQFRDIGNVRQTSTHHSRHVFRRIIRFQISCLVSYPRIARSMRLVESIRRKLFPVCPNLLKHFRVMSVLSSAFNKFRFHVIQLVTQLLTHRFTKRIRLTTGKIGQ